MYSVTLCNLTADARSAVEGGGTVDLGSLSSAELSELLGVFAEIDAVQNLKADPEIRIQTRKDRFIVRTGQRKLFLYDARRLSEAAFVLDPGEIMGELDGSAAAKRTVPPYAYVHAQDSEAAAASRAGSADADDLKYVPPTRPEPRRWTLALVGCALVLGAYAVYGEWAAEADDAPPALAPLSPAERQAEDAALTGVYMTGSEPGHHGIVILGDGRLKLFVVHAQAAPGVVLGTYRIGRLNTKLCLATDQPGGLITVNDRETLAYAGEIFKRLP
jgi:hypothetical protein